MAQKANAHLSTPHFCACTTIAGGGGGNVIGSVFVTGPHLHGGITGRKVVFVGNTVHPQLTVRVKNFGSQSPYANTSATTPPDSSDGVYIIPARTSTNIPTPHFSTSCSGTGCTVGTEGANYAVVSLVTGANVSTTIPAPYHVCKYDNAPTGSSQYFSPALYSSGAIQNNDCTSYPDAISVY